MNELSKQSNKNENEKLKGFPINNYFVAYLDIMGQKEKLLGTPDRITHIDEEKIQNVLPDTYFHIKNLRKYFLDYFNTASQPTSKLNHLAPEKRARFEKMKGHQPVIRGVADSIIITVPLINDGGNCPPLSIHSALYGICGVLVWSLMNEKPIRGGIDIGWGVPFEGDTDEIYGKAMVKAIELEEKCARYPRVVIGDYFIKYLSACINENVDAYGSNKIIQQKASKIFAGKCLKFLVPDFDSLPILDVIGESTKVVNKIPQEWVEKAYKFTVSQHGKYKIENDAKLISYYGSLRTYMESRLGIWNIKKVP